MDALKPVDLSNGNVAVLTMRLAIPSIVGLSINALQQAVNAFFVGALGAQAIAAVSMTLPIVVLLTAVGQGIGVGTASLVSRNVGAGNLREASTVASSALALALPIGVGITALLLLNLPALLGALGATPTIMPLALDYAATLLFGYTLMLLNIVNGFVVRAEGNTRFSMWTMVTAFALNTVLDPIFIFVLGMGVRGAAIATVVSQVAALVLYAMYFAGQRGIVHIRSSLVSMKVDRVKQIASVGASGMLANILSAIAFMLLYRVAAPFGDDAIAAVGIAVRLLTIGALPVLGFCIGSQAVLGFNWGAGNWGRVLEAARFMLIVALTYSIAFSLAMITFARPVVGLFNDSEAVTAVAASTCVMFHLFFGFFGVQAVLTTMLQSFGKARLSAIIALARQGYLFVPAILILPTIWGFKGLLASQAAAELAAGIIAVIVMLREVRELKARIVGPAGGLVKPAH
jgi:putative MATE family efflux protein